MIKPAYAAQAECNDVTIGAVKQIAVNLQAQIAQFGSMMGKLGAIENKEVQKYTCVFSDSHHKHGAKKQILKAKWLATNKRKEGRKVRCQKRSTIIPSCIAKLVTSTVLKFCKSRACQWQASFQWPPSKAKQFGFAFDRSSLPSPSSTPPSDHGRQSNPHLLS